MIEFQLDEIEAITEETVCENKEVNEIENTTKHSNYKNDRKQLTKNRNDSLGKKLQMKKHPLSQNADVSGDISKGTNWVIAMSKRSISSKRVKPNE